MCKFVTWAIRPRLPAAREDSGVSPTMSPARQRLHDAALHLFAERGSSEVSVSELAQAAGIARGTVYNNIESLDEFFDDVSRDLAYEMRDRMLATFVDVRDPARRMADGLRFFVRRAHREPGWGRFVARFGSVNATVQALWGGPSMDDFRAGCRRGRFTVGADHEPGVMALVNGTTITAMWLVLEGHETWRRVGSSSAELVLRALGVPGDEAHALATADLPELRPLPAPPSPANGSRPPSPDAATDTQSHEPDAPGSPTPPPPPTSHAKETP
jgi:AcrR family transcriptional regulator